MSKRPYGRALSSTRRTTCPRSPALQAAPALPADLEIRGVVLAAVRAAKATGLHAFRTQRRQHGLGPRPVGGTFEPYLRLSDIGRHIADDALHVLIEYVRRNTRLLQPVQHEVGIEAIERDIEAFHAPMSQAQPPRVKAIGPRCRRARRRRAD